MALDATPGTCPRCRETVLIVHMDGQAIPVEPVELLAAYPCPRCRNVANRGNVRRSVCEMCLGLGVLGEPLPPYGVAVAADGSAREFDAKHAPRKDEAAHLPHTCELAVGRETAPAQAAAA